jgi:hypothetical protein
VQQVVDLERAQAAPHLQSGTVSAEKLALEVGLQAPGVNGNVWEVLQCGACFHLLEQLGGRSFAHGADEVRDGSVRVSRVKVCIQVGRDARVVG